MATSATKIGRVSINPQGEYSSGTQYQRLDVITYNGSGYICIKDCQNKPVSNTEYWYLLASKGDTYEVTEEDLQRIASQIEEDASSLFNQLVAQKTSEFNANAVSKTEDFNANATSKTGEFDSNATSKTSDFNTNATNKTDVFNTNATQKGISFDANYDDKLGLFNGNATTKTNDYNDNASAKTTSFNSNASSKTTTFNNNATDKTNAFNTNAEEKTEDFDEHVASYTTRLEEVEDVSEVNANHIRALEDNFDVSTSINSNDYTITDSASGYNKGNIKFGDREIEQTTTTGKNKLVNEGLENTTVNDITYTKNSDGSVNVNGTTTNTVSDYYLYGSNVDRGNYFYIPQGNYKLKSLPTNMLYIFREKTAGTKTTYALIESLLASQDCYFYGIAIRVPENKTVSSTAYPQLEEGSTSTDYEPYTGGQASPSPDYPQDIHIVEGECSVEESNRNLFNSLNSWVATSVSYGAPSSATSITSQIINNGLNNVSFNKESSGTCGVYSKLINLKANIQYTFSFKLDFKASNNAKVYCSLAKYTSGVWERVLAIGNYTSSLTVTANYTPSSNQQIALVVYGTADYTYSEVNVNDIQIEQGSTATSYVPHKGNTFPLTLPQGMFLGKIGTSSNYIYGTKDNWKLHSGLNKIVLDSSTSFGGVEVSSNYYRIPLDISNITDIGATRANDILCNKYRASTTNNYNICFHYNRRVFFYLPEGKSTKEEFIASIGENMFLYYPIATPTDTDITDTTLITQLNAIADNLQTYKGETVVFTTGSDLAPNIQFEYMVNPFASVEARLDLLEA